MARRQRQMCIRDRPRLAFFSFKRGDLKVSDSTCAISGIASVYPRVTVGKSVVIMHFSPFYRFLVVNDISGAPKDDFLQIA